MFKKRKKRPTISAPVNFEHRIHAGYDMNTGKFVGLPVQWTSIIENQKDDRRRSISNARELDNSSQNSRCESVDPSNLDRNQLNELKRIVRGHNDQEFTLNSLSSNSLNQSYPYGGSLNSINQSNVQQSLSNSLNWINYPVNLNPNSISSLNQSTTSSLSTVYHSTPPKQLPHQLNRSNQQIPIYSPIGNGLIKSPLTTNSLINQINNLSLNNQSINSSIDRSSANQSANSPVANSSSLINASLNNSSISASPMNSSFNGISQSDDRTINGNSNQETNVKNLEFPDQYYRLSPFQRHLYANFLPAQIQQQFFHLPYPQQQRLLQAALEKQQQLQSPQYQLQLKLKRERQLQYLQERERERQLQLLIAQKQQQTVTTSSPQLRANPSITPATLLEQYNKQTLSLEQLRFALQTICSDQNPIGQFDFIRKIADGSTASIYLASSKQNRLNSSTGQSNDLVVIKKLNLEKQKRRELLLNEIALMRIAKHPNIVNMYASYLVGDIECWIVMEFCAGSILTDTLTRNKMTEIQIATVARQCLSALAFLCAQRILHRDVKSDSILLTIDGVVKLSDFGFATQLSEQVPRRRSLAGTPYWIAPEVINREEYGCEIDIWSLGVLCIEMIDSSPPFFNHSPLEAMRIISQPETQLQANQPVSDDLNDFLRKMLIRNPIERATAVQLLEHPFITKKSTSPDILKPLIKPIDIRK